MRPSIEKTALIIVAIALFVGGCALGVIANDQILRGLSLALPPLIAAEVWTPYIFPMSIALALGLFLATPTIAVALARPLMRSLLVRCIAAYLLSAVISVGAALVWFRWGVTHGRSTLTMEDIPVLSVPLAGPVAVLILAAVLSARYGKRQIA